jgi:hypothetical protein
MPPSVEEAWTYFWVNRRNLVVRSGLVCGVAFILGFAMGLAVPRVTTVVGTSLMGIFAVVMGVGTWVTVYRHEWWTYVNTHLSWFAMAVGLLVLMSIMTQITQRRPAVAPSATPVPATA